MRLLRWDAPGPYEVAFSTRDGGVSEGPYASLNLGRLTSDEPDRVDENRRRLCDAVCADEGRLAFNHQQQGADVRRAEPGLRGEPADALWTDARRLPLLVFAADCAPVAVTRTDGAPALALVHAGWRGLLGGVVAAGVDALGGTTAAVVGPTIGPCCYEVAPELADRFASRFGSDVVRGRNLDLPEATERALREAGCARVERIDLCTACHPELFFSHRRDGGVTGRQGVIGYVA